MQSLIYTPFHLLPKKSIHFVYLGANIGEFLLDYSDHPSIHHLTAFEPLPENQKVLLKCIDLNHFTQANVVAKPFNSYILELSLFLSKVS